jgi:hypothetical protein
VKYLDMVNGGKHTLILSLKNRSVLAVPQSSAAGILTISKRIFNPHGSMPFAHLTLCALPQPIEYLKQNRENNKPYNSHKVVQGILVHKRMVRFQKLTRNLFLTLHGHNVHHQQRELSKFLMR